MGGVIRRENVPAASAFSFQDVESEAERILARARAHAARVLQEADVRSAELARQRQRAGYEQGLAEGRVVGLQQAKEEARAAALQTAQAELSHLTQALRAALDRVEADKRRLLAQAESGLIELAVAIARRVCKTLTERSAAPALANARAVLELVQHHDDAVLRVNPADYELLREVASPTAGHIAGLEHVTVTPEPDVARGGCRLETRAAEIDASIVGQLDRVAAAICASAEAPPAPTPEPTP
ncbi:MAG: hypothetical protein KA383_02510 [Phycisphaerae bacterium]|jgi:flagellar assembly protein FliH|nr:hypothetical protein [Phycisphaerae bacterium]